MKFKKLGNTDLNVSLICLGTMTWGEQNTQADAFEQMDYSVDQGVNFFDTAELYAVPPKAETYTKTEIMIGNWFAEKHNREKIILATKISGHGCSWIRGGGMQYAEENITKAIEGSLTRLKTDYIDLYQLHWPERNTNFFSKLGYKHKEDEEEWNSFESILKTLNKFVDQGKIRHIGLSNETPYGFAKFLNISEKCNLPRVVSVQNPYSLVNRTYEVGMAEISIRDKAGLLAYSPLGFGVLSGKYLNNQMPEGSRLKLFGEHFPRYQGSRTSQAVEEYYKVAKKYDLSLTQMSLAFVNQQEFVTSNIIGATTMNQLKENVTSINIKLEEDVMSEINKIHHLNPNPAP
ncbi:MAG: aldo/keto reductase [Pelagibacteraceae bacterium]|nr:aldo/keto reductase [Pelagibacteraceae bacterium]|tara:strand:- start:1241 stop:2281 length:1041 start_codon:yes stop_codon:yes gene_type:complete